MKLTTENPPPPKLDLDAKAKPFAALTCSEVEAVGGMAARVGWHTRDPKGQRSSDWKHSHPVSIRHSHQTSCEPKKRHKKRYKGTSGPYEFHSSEIPSVQEEAPDMPHLPPFCFVFFCFTFSS